MILSSSGSVIRVLKCQPGCQGSILACLVQSQFGNLTAAANLCDQTKMCSRIIWINKWSVKTEAFSEENKINSDGKVLLDCGVENNESCDEKTDYFPTLMLSSSAAGNWYELPAHWCLIRRAVITPEDWK